MSAFTKIALENRVVLRMEGVEIHEAGKAVGK